MFSLSFARMLVWLTLLLALFAVVAGPVMAQEGPGGEAPAPAPAMEPAPAPAPAGGGEDLTDSEAAAESAKGPVWALGYIGVLVLVGGGTFCVVRGSKRKARAKPEQYQATITK